jgi:hypothetical protein
VVEQEQRHGRQPGVVRLAQHQGPSLNPWTLSATSARAIGRAAVFAETSGKDRRPRPLFRLPERL